MKNISIIALLTALVFVPQETRALSDAGVATADANVARQVEARAAAVEVTAIDAHLTRINLPLNDKNRAAVADTGGSARGVPAEVVLLKVLQTDGVPGIDATDDDQQGDARALIGNIDVAAVTAENLPLAAALIDHAGGVAAVTAENLPRAAAILGAGLNPVHITDANLELAGALIDHAGGVAAVTAENLPLAAALIDHAGGAAAVTAENLPLAAALIDHAGGVAAVTAENLPRAAAILGADLDVGEVTAENLELAGALIDHAGGAAAVTAANLRLASVMADAGLNPVHITAANLTAAALLQPMINLGFFNRDKLGAVLNATRVSDEVRDAVVWAINTGFRGQPPGTIPSGVAIYDSNTGGGNPRFIVELGAVPFSATAGRFNAANRFLVERAGVAGMELNIGDRIVFTDLTDSAAPFITLVNGAKVP